MSEWSVPGYDVQELLGFGASGEVWRARERSSGAVVALRRLSGGDRDVVAAVRAQATVVRSLPTAHLVRLRTTTRAGDDDVLVLDDAPGGSLAALLLRRGRLDPGEVVTAVAPLADALGQAHAHGLVHGRVRASSVLLTADGMPLLDGLGLACLHDADDTLDPTGGLGAAADVWGLGALAHLLLTGEEPGTTILATLAPRAPLPLVRAVEAALGFDPTARPTAADLAASLLAACPAQPLRGLITAAEPPPARVSAPRLGRRRALTVVAVPLAVVVVMGAGWAWGAHPPERPARVAGASSSPVPAPDWRSVLRGLDGARADAFARADISRLADVYAPASALLAVDQRAVRGLSRLRRTAVGVEHEVRSLTLVRVEADRVELRVVESLASYHVLDPAGRVVAQHAPGAAVTHAVVLAQLPQGWRVSKVRLVR
ncbi:MAG: serine/threonine protein kinase [Frankiales bacterium]|nr:serine/threonine protein kinase [Frankiales bacterium]